MIDATPARPAAQAGRLDAGALFGPLVAVLAVALAALAIGLLRPPEAVPASAPADAFSAERAAAHLPGIASAPHPSGSPEQEQARLYLLQELRALGLDPQIQAGAVVTRRDLALIGSTDIYLSGAQVQNVLVRLPGSAGDGRALLLMAHYDSVPNGPGANDNGVAVVALLETLRALQAGPPLKNDLIVLFSDGEELGLLGARLFREQHPWAGDVALVVNLEARGSAGPALLFETSVGNGRLIDGFARSAPSPFASSLFYEVYKMLPNETDLTVFKDAGVPGMNFAYIDGFVHYHADNDSIAHVDPRNIQHHGGYALALARFFGEADLGALAEQDAVFFNPLGTLLLVYPYSWVLPLAALAALLFVAAAALGWRRGAVTPGGLLLGFLAALAPLALSALLLSLVWQGVLLIHPEYVSLRQGDLYNDQFYMIAFACLAVLLTALWYALLRTRLRPANLSLGALLLWLLLTFAASVLLPGGSYLFLWPLLLCLVAQIAVLAMRLEPGGLRAAALQSGAALAGVLLLAPVVTLLFVSLTVFIGHLISILVVLVAGLFVPYLLFVAERARWLLPAAAGGGAAAMLVAGALTAGFDSEHPKQNSLLYSLDLDQQAAQWASTDEITDPWNQQYIPPGSPRGRMEQLFPFVPTQFLQAPAPLAPYAAPELTLLEERTDGDTRSVRLRLRSPRGATASEVYVGQETLIKRLLLDGQEVYARTDTSPARWSMTYWTLPPEGVELLFELPAGAPLTINANDQSVGMPDLPNVRLIPRPDYSLSSPFGFEGGTFTRVRKTYRFDPQ